MADDNKPSTLYHGLLLAAIVLIGLTAFQVDLFSNYGKTTDDLSYLNVADEVADEAAQLKESIESTKITGIDPLDKFIAGTYNTLKLMFGVGDIFTSFVSNIASTLMIPAALAAIIIAAILTSIIVAIISIITKMRA